MLAGKERVVVRLGTGQPCCWCAQDSEGPEKLRRAEQTLVQRAGLSLLPVTLCRRGWAQAVSTHGNCRVSAVQMPGGGAPSCGGRTPGTLIPPPPEPSSPSGLREDLGSK